MRPTVSPPLVIRGIEFGGPKALFCVPLVATNLDDLRTQAEIAHNLGPDLVEWRADFHLDLTPESAREAIQLLRQILDRELIIFTLRVKSEGGKNNMSQDERLACIESVLQTGAVDLIDVELCNESSFLDRVKKAAQDKSRVILSFHDFERTPDEAFLDGKIADMVKQKADVAKIACMPQDPADVLRLLDVTLHARKAFPSLPLCTMSMAGLGCITRVAGFLYGSDMAFAVGKESSAPGQIPLAEARSITESLLRYA